MKKRILTLLLAVMMVCSLLPFAAAAADLSPYTKLITDTAVPDDAGLLKDLDGDGTEELYMVVDEDGVPVGRLYTIVNGQTKKLMEFRYDGPSIHETNHYAALNIINNGGLALVVTTEEYDSSAPGYPGYYWNEGTLTFYQLKNGSMVKGDVMRYKLLMHDDGSNMFSGNHSTITMNGQAISADQMNAVFRRVENDAFGGYPMAQVYAATRGSFQDVELDSYYEDPVAWAKYYGITNGTTNVDFSPNAVCTRGQVVTFLWRAAGSPKVSGARNPFADVRSTDYYYNAVLWAVQKGITNGTSSTTFSPNESCTRGQIATFLWRFEGSPKVSTKNPFVDVRSGEYYYNAVLWAVNAQVTNGTDSTHFSPNAACTRAMIVTFLYRDIVE